MTGKGLARPAPQSKASGDAGQDEPATIRARSRASEVREIEVGVKRMGFPSLSEGVRSVMKIAVRSQEVEASVLKNLHFALNPTKAR